MCHKEVTSMTHQVHASVPRLASLPRLAPRSRSLVALSSLDSDLTKLVALQRQADKLGSQASQLRASIVQGMTSAGLAKYQSPSGVRANLFTSSRFNIDRAKLKRILKPQQFAAVLKPVSSTVLRVR
jgi:hypothetical protein